MPTGISAGRARRALVVLAAASATSLGAAIPSTALAEGSSTPYADISSAGPLKDVYVGNDLSCQVLRNGQFQVYGEIPADCGTIAAYGDQLYTPHFEEHERGSATRFSSPVLYTLVSQSAITGSGTESDPFSVRTVVDAGSELELDETDSYVVGNEYFTVAIKATNLGESTLPVELYRAQDCYLGGNDEGYGWVSGTINACATTANNQPASFIEALVPAASPESHHLETTYYGNWEAVDSQQPLSDECDCETSEDNGNSVSWTLSLAAGESQTVTVSQVYSGSGEVPPAPVPPPVAETAPSLPAGAPAAETAVTATPGTFTGAESVRYGWQLCATEEPSSCVEVPGAEGTEYTPGSEQAGEYLRFVETGSNTSGPTTQYSAIVGPVTGGAPAPPAPPVAVVAPGLSLDAPVAGTADAAEPGTFSGAESVSYGWQLCTTEEATSCVDVAGAEGTEYTPGSEEVGEYLRFAETGSNTSGPTTQYSAIVGPIAAATPPPVDESLPVVVTQTAIEPETAPVEGTELSVIYGVFSGAEYLDIEWQRCAVTGPGVTPNGTGMCSTIPGATTFSYTPVAADVGDRLRFVEIAHNHYGSTTQYSEQVGPVTAIVPAPPVSGTPPVVVSPGAPSAEAPLTGQAGTFTGGETYGYEWQRCTTADPSSCTTIPGADTPTYTPGAADVGDYLRFVETATNGGGPTSQASALIGPIKGAATTAVQLKKTPFTIAGTPVMPAAPASPIPTTRAACRSTRSETIHWKTSRGVHLRSTRVSVNGTRFRTLPAHRPEQITISLVGRRKGTVWVQIVGTSDSGRHYSAGRTYQPCIAGTRHQQPKNLYLTER